MPEIERVWQAYQDQGFVVLGVDTTFQDSEPDVVAFVRELKLTFPILLDRGGGTSNRYQLRALPSTFFVDRQGVIRSAVLGAMNAGLIESKVAELVGETQ
jgi:peroxiredoxin